ncbi:hypothetical protein, partial [Halorubrum distributum]
MTNRNTSALLVAIVAIAGIGLAFGAGGAAAQTNSTDFIDDPVEVTNDTESVYVDVTGVSDMNGSAPIGVNVTMTGLAAGQDVANGTVLNETTLSVGENATESLDVALSDTDREDYDSVHVTVSTADVSLIDTYDYGTVGSISGG